MSNDLELTHCTFCGTLMTRANHPSVWCQSLSRFLEIPKGPAVCPKCLICPPQEDEEEKPIRQRSYRVVGVRGL